MNNEAPFAFPSADTVLSIVMVGGLAFVSAMMVAVASLQTVVA